MKRIVLLVFILVSFAPSFVFCQETYFKISPTSDWISRDSTSYVIVKKEGFTASQLFTLVKMNVSKVYRSPKDVMSEVEDKSISIRAYTSLAGYNSLMGIVDYFGDYYNLIFEFKDGKIRVSAPIFEVDKSNSLTDYTSNMRKAFNKKGLPKSNRAEKLITDMQSYMDNIISSLIKTEESTKDNW